MPTGRRATARCHPPGWHAAGQTAGRSRLYPGRVPNRQPQGGVGNGSPLIRLALARYNAGELVSQARASLAEPAGHLRMQRFRSRMKTQDTGVISIKMVGEGSFTSREDRHASLLGHFADVAGAGGVVFAIPSEALLGRGGS